jgi:hypothetical protein
MSVLAWEVVERFSSDLIVESIIDEREIPWTISIGLAEKQKENIQAREREINQPFSARLVIEWNVKFGGRDNCFVNGKNRIFVSFKN